MIRRERSFIASVYGELRSKDLVLRNLALVRVEELLIDVRGRRSAGAWSRQKVLTEEVFRRGMRSKIGESF